MDTWVRLASGDTWHLVADAFRPTIRAMTRRGDPALISAAQRAGIFNQLRDAERLDELDAEHWIARWEREAEATGRERGSTGDWDEGWRWIGAQHHPPKSDMSAEGDERRCSASDAAGVGAYGVNPLTR